MEAENSTVSGGGATWVKTLILETALFVIAAMDSTFRMETSGLFSQNTGNTSDGMYSRKRGRDMDELKPCPLCGSGDVAMMHPNDEYTGEEIENQFFVLCYGCLFESGIYWDAELLQTLWNRRFEADGAK